MLRQLFRFAAAKRGNVALIFAFAIIPFLLLAGFAIDIGRAILVRERLGHAIDAAILAVGASPHLTDEEAQQFGEDFFDANFNHPMGAVAHDIQVDVAGDIVTISARADVPTTLLALLNHENIGLYQEAEATRGGQDLELVMVLDNTYSMMMPSSKIADLRTAAATAAETVFNAAGSDPDSVKIGLVPFAGSVNVGSSMATRPYTTPGNVPFWLDPNGDNPDHHNAHTWNADINRWELYEELDVTWDGCVEARPEPYDMDDTTPTASDGETLFIPYFAADTPGNRNAGQSGFSNASSWIADGQWTRAMTPSSSNSGLTATQIAQKALGLLSTLGLGTGAQFHNNHNASRQAYVGKYYETTQAPYGRGPNLDCILDPITPMTNDEADVVAEIEGMTALATSGYTNIPNGIAWGIRVLSEGAPFTEGRPWNDEELVKALIILTDGENYNPTPGLNNYNSSTYTAYGYVAEGRMAGVTTSNATTLRNALDVKTAEACEIAKDLGARVYTITLMIGDADTEQMMSDCASEDEFGDPLYWDSPSSDQLDAIFAEIARDLVDLRLSR